VLDLIRPDWPVPTQVRTLSTTRVGGISRGPWLSFNLGRHCGDDVEHVAENHRRLADHLPSAPRWLAQHHGTRLIHLDDWRPEIEADAAWTDRPGQIAAILTADCLPILLSHCQDSLVAAVHAGWRGLASGIIEQTVSQLPSARSELMAWIGPGISGRCYEVGEEVREAFVDQDPALAGAFDGSRAGHYWTDLKMIARHLLAASGVNQVHDAGLCTASEKDRFFSFRRDGGRTGRQASLIWIEATS
jgi:polyphenol oxidase